MANFIRVKSKTHTTVLVDEIRSLEKYGDNITILTVANDEKIIVDEPYNEVKSRYDNVILG